MDRVPRPYRGKRLTQTTEAERGRRSKKQNDRYWALSVPLYQEWVGEENEEQAQEDLLAQCNTTTRILPTGEVISRHTPCAVRPL